jgi:hypothetical protein
MYLQTLYTAATVIRMILFEVRIEMSFSGQGFIAQRADNFDVQVKLFLVGLNVGLVVCLELEGLAANAT